MRKNKWICHCIYGCVLGALLVGSGIMQAGAAAPESSAPAADITDQLIVKYRTSRTGASLTARDQTLVGVAANSGHRLQRFRRGAQGEDIFRLQAKIPTDEVEKLARAIASSDPEVLYAEPDRILTPQLVPNDPRYNEQWHYFEPTGGLNLPNAWDLSTGSGVVVAVIDTGYRPHADLAAHIVGGYDFISDTPTSRDGDGRDADPTDPGDYVAAGECGNGNPALNSTWHGTHVSGTIAALTNNGSGVAGVAFDARVLPVRVLGRCGGHISDIADALIWASGGTVPGVPTNTHPAQVANLSLGGPGSCEPTMQNAITSARSRGTVVVVSAGNNAQDASGSTPANCSAVVTVASVNRSGGRAYYSNFGSVVEIAAPGGDTSSGAANGVLSTLNSGTTTPAGDAYAFYQGTSMAAPHVAGVAALMLARDPSLTPDQVLSTLQQTARSFPSSCSGCGVGIVDAYAAVHSVMPNAAFLAIINALILDDE